MAYKYMSSPKNEIVISEKTKIICRMDQVRLHHNQIYSSTFFYIDENNNSSKILKFDFRFGMSSEKFSKVFSRYLMEASPIDNIEIVKNYH
jgi:hypothetical protein